MSRGHHPYTKEYRDGASVAARLYTQRYGELHLLKAKVLDNSTVIAYYGSYARRYLSPASSASSRTTATPDRRKSQ